MLHYIILYYIILYYIILHTHTHTHSHTWKRRSVGFFLKKYYNKIIICIFDIFLCFYTWYRRGGRTFILELKRGFVVFDPRCCCCLFQRCVLCVCRVCVCVCVRARVRVCLPELLVCVSVMCVCVRARVFVWLCV